MSDHLTAERGGHRHLMQRPPRLARVLADLRVGGDGEREGQRGRVETGQPAGVLLPGVRAVLGREAVVVHREDLSIPEVAPAQVGVHVVGARLEGRVDVSGWGGPGVPGGVEERVGLEGFGPRDQDAVNVGADGRDGAGDRRPRARGAQAGDPSAAGRPGDGGSRVDRRPQGRARGEDGAQGVEVGGDRCDVGRRGVVGLQHDSIEAIAERLAPGRRPGERGRPAVERRVDLRVGRRHEPRTVLSARSGTPAPRDRRGAPARVLAALGETQSPRTSGCTGTLFRRPGRGSGRRTERGDRGER